MITGLLLLARLAECVERDPYQVLGVRRSSTQREITRAFRTLSRQYHPDKNPSKDTTANFQEISAAYEYLTDPARQNKPWEWDFSEGAKPGKGGRGRRGPYSAYDAFDAFQGTYHFVLDLDPMRIIGIGRTWFDQHKEKHQHTYDTLWRSSVDRAVCHALQSGWKLPRLLEPPLMYLAKQKMIYYTAGQWRGWPCSGILLELGFWVARQTPCLQYAAGSSSSTESDTSTTGGDGSGSAGRYSADGAREDSSSSSSAYSGPVTDEERLVELQQQLHTHRKLRQQLLQPSAKAQQRSSAGKSSKSSSSSKGRSRSGSIMLDGFTADLSQLQLLQGRLLWWALLLAGCWLLLHDRQMLLAGFGLVVIGLWSLFWGAGGSEGAVEALQAALDANSWFGWAIGVWYTAACAALCLLLPLVLASCVLLLATWLWAAVSCSSIAMTPCVSRMGLSLWIGLQLWLYSNGELLRGGAIAVGVCAVLYKRPSLAIWWVSMLFSPVLFSWHLLRFMALSWGHWLGLTQRSPELAAKIAAAITARQAQMQLRDGQPQKQEESRGGTVNGAAASSDGPPVTKGRKMIGPGSSAYSTAVPAAAPAAAATASPAADFGSAGAYPPRRTGLRRATRAARVTVWSIFNGPWWPATFRPEDLAFTCYWWIRMVGWVLPWRALTAAVIAIKIAFAVAAFSVAAGAFGVPGSWMTVGRLVQVVLLRLGAGAGVLWVGSCVLDDLARIIDPMKWAKRQQRRLQKQRRGQPKQRQGPDGRARAESPALN